MLFGILLTVQIIICLVLVGLVLIQRSEGGALGMGGSPSGFMSARGAGNFLTQATAVLAILFFANSIGLTIVGNISMKGRSVVDQIGENNISLDAAKTSPTPAPAEGGAASSAAVPSLTELPAPSARAVTAPAATAPQASLSSLPAPQVASKPAVVAPKPVAKSASSMTSSVVATASVKEPIQTEPAQ